jgi:hypothetical protein
MWEVHALGCSSLVSFVSEETGNKIRYQESMDKSCVEDYTCVSTCLQSIAMLMWTTVVA